MMPCRTSSKTGANVDELFAGMVRRLMNDRDISTSALRGHGRGAATKHEGGLPEGKSVGSGKLGRMFDCCRVS